MPEGFTVRLGSLADFANVAREVVTDYGAVTDQLTAADLSRADPHFSTLLGVSKYAGSTEVNAAGRDMLAKYVELYSGIVRMHTAVKARLEEIVTALEETHQLYTDLDNTQHAVYRGLRADTADQPEGGR